MASGSRAAKVELWRERFGRFDDRADQEGPVKVSEFCRAEGISTSSFYNWRRKLARSKPQASSRRQRQKKKKQTACRGVFEPVTIVAAATVGIRLSDGTSIEVPTHSENALRVIVGQLVCNQRQADQC